MQAQNTAEEKKSKKGRQNPAPPAGSKAGGLGIAKEFVDFLLEHDVFQFTFPAPCKLFERFRYDAFATEEMGCATRPHNPDRSGLLAVDAMRQER